MKRFGKHLALLVIGCAMASAAAPAGASTTLRIAHTPMPLVAIDGANMHLAVAVASSCKEAPLDVCGPVTLTTHYIDGAGVERTVSNPLTFTGGVAAPVIPGGQDWNTTLTYWFTASQYWCDYHCYTTTTRMPSTGAFNESVVG